MASALIELHYLPCVAYFAAILRADEVILERNENYTKQSYRNRCHLNSADGADRLIIPLIKKEGKMPITEVEIDYSQKWLNNHWRTIQSSYGKAAFFEYYSEDLHAVFYRKEPLLYNFNYSLLTLCLSWLGCSTPVKESQIYEKEAVAPVVDLRSTILPKKEAILNFRPYTQVFGNKFVKNLSVIDLIFCLGPESREYIRTISEQ